MLLLKRKTFEVGAEGSLLAESEAGAVAQAADIVAAAEAEAAQLHDAAKAAYAEERRRGYEAGLAEGREQILSQKLAMVEKSVEYMESIESKVGELVQKVLTRCLGEMDAAERVNRLVVKAMEEIVRNQREITVSVSPAMLDSVKSRMSAILSEFPSVTNAEVKADARLKDDACLVETSAGVVEVSVSGQLDSIARTLKKYLSREA